MTQPLPPVYKIQFYKDADCERYTTVDEVIKLEASYIARERTIAEDLKQDLEEIRNFYPQIEEHKAYQRIEKRIAELEKKEE